MESQFVIYHYGITFSVVLAIFYYSILSYFNAETNRAHEWMVQNSLEEYQFVFESQGLTKLVDFADVETIQDMPPIDAERTLKACRALKQDLIFSRWLNQLGLAKYAEKLSNENLHSIEDVYWLDDTKALSMFGKDFAIWNRGRQMLPNNKELLQTLKEDLWEGLKFRSLLGTIWFHGSVMIASLCASGLVTCLLINGSRLSIKSEESIFHIITGRFLDVNMCTVQFTWSDPYPVGETLSFTVKFFQRNGLPYPVCDRDRIQFDVTCGARRVEGALTLGGMDPEQANTAVMVFTVRVAGVYRIAVLAKDEHVRGSPFERTFLPGPVDPSKTKCERHCSIVICIVDITSTIFIQPRDSFHNCCLNGASLDTPTSENPGLENYHSIIKQAGEERTDVCFQSFYWNKQSSKISFDMVFQQEGCYRVQIYYKDTLLLNGDFTCLVLNRTDYEISENNINNRNVTYEGRLVRVADEPPMKPKKVLMFISSKQFTIKEYLLKFIPKRVATFRLCPSTKFHLSDVMANGVPSFSVEDGTQPTIYLSSTNRNLIAATFTKFLLKNIGGSETFKEKQLFFYYEVRRYHQKHKHDPITIRVDRQNLLHTSLKATKHFTIKEWCSKFEVVFIGELGVDWGGLRREWFQLTCASLFSSANKLFQAFSDNPQALVHPNRNRPSNLKLKYYEFAGRLLGKCLYESSLGGSYSQFITAKFTRSFLAQIIGLRIHYHYFQFDDPDLYLTKIKYILDSDITDMDLYFIDEEYDGNGQLNNIVDLIPNGYRTKVTNASKRQYLDCLAQYRLAIRVKEEVESFQKGLYEIIPDNLLCIFDENELELLMCGTGTYSISDLRAHHVVNSPQQTPDNFDRALKWFWIAVANFGTEEMARLLQFTTGSSQLPPGGFAELTPRFQITPSFTYGNLPTAHTCFNQICLPDYDNYEQFEKSLLLAITEGNEGFGLS